MGAINVDNMHIDGTHGIFALQRACKWGNGPTKGSLLSSHPQFIDIELNYMSLILAITFD